ncbi:tape measure protein [Providencia sp. PROV108]|uniref:tape measure protein n=1 Tax=Providencia sp. PROV108 TaxID=2949820 RepID=UPI002349ABD2|nr:tape measure protein [Providencia sp. PROV108]
MAESQSVGGIHYDVAMDVKPLLSGERQVYTSLDRMEGSFNKASKSIDSAEKSMFSFSKAAVAVTSALSVGAIVHAVDEWGQMAARIKMALKSVEGDIEKYGEIQERFLEISNRNGKAIETVQSIYAGSATSMKELGYSTQQTIDYIESLSSAFTANATGVQQTESAMNALNRAMVVGTLKGNDWHSVLNATPSVVGDIAKELSRLRGGVKVTENEVKKMAMETGISMKLFVDSTTAAKDANNALADSMDNTIQDGFTKLTNSAKAYYGELNQTLGITRSVSAGFALLTENFDKASSAITAMVAIGAAKYFGSLANSMKNSTIQTINQSKAIRENANAQLEAAQQAQRRAAAEVRNAQLDRARLQNNIDQNKRSQQSVLLSNEIIAAQQRERAAKLALVQANNAVAASQERINAASAIGARAVGILKSAMALVGGPAGVAMLAGGALLYYWQQAETAKQKSLDFADSIESLTNRMKELSDVALMGNVAEAGNSIDVQREAIEKLQGELKTLNENYQWTIDKTADYQRKSESLEKQQREIAIKTKEIDEAQDKLARTIKYVSDATGELTTRNKELYDSMNDATGIAGKMGAAIGALQKKIKAAADAQRDLNDAKREEPETEEGKKAILNLKEENELLRIKDKRQRAIRKAEMEAAKVTNNPTQRNEIIAESTAYYDLTEAERQREKQSKSSTKTSDDASKAIKKQLDEIERLSKGYDDGSKKLAQYDAVKALGDKASPEQKAQAERLAGELFDIEQRLADKRAALAANATATAEKLKSDEIEQLDRQLKANLVTEEQYQKRRAEINAEYSKKIAEENAKSVITPTQEMAGQLDPVQQLANENAQKLALIQEYVNQKVLTEEQGLALMNAANREYEQSRFDAMWGLWKGQNDLNNLMGTAIDSLSSGTATAVSAMLSGTQSAGDAMRNLANTALNAMIQQLMQMAVQALITRTILGTFMGGLGAIPNIASVASSVTSLSNIGGMGMPTDFRSYGGARYSGGPVDANKMYQVGEHGKPEIFKASTGKQYMIPGDNGRVISNKDMQGSGSSMPPIINVYQQASGAAVDVTTEKGLNAQDVVNIVVRNIMEGREISGAVSTHHNAPRKATGSL